MGATGRTCLAYDVICKRSPIDVEAARKMYVHERMSAKAIAEKLGCAEATVLDWRKNYGWHIQRKEWTDYATGLRKAADEKMHRELVAREIDNVPETPETRTERLMARIEGKMIKEIETDFCPHCERSGDDPDKIKKYAETLKILLTSQDLAMRLAKNEGKVSPNLRQVVRDPDENDEASDEELEELRRIREGVGGNSPHLIPVNYERGDHLSEEQKKQAAYEQGLERQVQEHDELLAAKYREEKAADG